MTYNEYLDKRNGLVNEAQALIDAGSIEESKEKMEAVDALDAEWDTTAQALADLRALSDNQRMVNFADYAVQPKEAVVVEKVDFTPQSAEIIDAKSNAYTNAWAKLMMGQKLTDAESETISMVNSALTTVSTGAVIPTTVSDGIWNIVEKEYPLWADCQKTFVNGNYNLIVSTASSDAAWYDEATNTADGSETLVQIQLVGCELARAITVSWKLREMAIADFIPFIQRKLAEKIGAALGYGVSHGKGQPGQNDTFKPEPKGIITALLAETNTPQVITYTAGSLSYANLATARSKISVGANELAIYANAATIWTELANVKDTTNRPIMIADPTAGGVNRIFGIPVKEDDSLSNGEVLFSAPSVGYIANVNKDMTLSTEEHVKARTADYCAYAIVDGNVITTKAHALLKNS